MRHFFKKYLVAGALVLVPIAVTVWVLKTIILWCEGIYVTLVPEAWEIPGIGVIFTLLLIFLTGVLTRLYLGRKLLALGDRIIQKIPFGRGIYVAIKQFVNALAATSGRSFNKVVLVEFPQPGSFVIGFVTSETPLVLKKNSEQKLVNVFIPTALNPTAGFLLIVPPEKTTPIDLSTEQAFKLVVSAGTVHP